MLIIVLLIFASPILLGVGGGLLGGLVGIFGGLIAVIAAIAACGFSLLVCGVVGVVWGIVKLFFSPMAGMILIGVSGLSLALGILFAILFAWLVIKWLPALFRWFVNLCQRLLHRDKTGERRDPS